MSRLIDISQPVGPGTAVWPGDRPFELEWTLRRDAGDSVDVAAVSLSVHTGTHVDGPRHTGAGPGAGVLPLAPFVGPAVVVDGRPHIHGDPPVVGAGVLDGVDVETGPRVLIRTREGVAVDTFPEPFAALSQALARRLVEEGFVLVGTDAPSVDPVDSETLDSHRVLAEAGIPNVENLDLSGVEPGRYTFIGLPLRLVGTDSSPVRAVLVADRISGAGSQSVAEGSLL